MATIIQDPGDREVVREVHDGGGSGVIVGVLLALVIIALILFYGVPRFRHSGTNGATGTLNVNVQTPASNGGTTPAP